jgi:hypothetical protein
MDPFQITIHAICFQTLLGEKPIANRMDPYQTAWMRRLVWIHAVSQNAQNALCWNCRDTAQFMNLNEIMRAFYLYVLKDIFQ